ncbi:hypothetical protein ZIOFF_004897 [Zingiber officinale]|uniref:Uncharacterized protein n=1 Tax=Zingiber officinale TaxID=94328 RepID=A0A8J5I104_ZINOF|nr:hypothetical protein ZIOFF_004897 [Zingiber officinale]
MNLEGSSTFFFLFILLLVDQCVYGYKTNNAKPVSKVHKLSRDAFPHDFVFGIVASAYQVEGEALKGCRGPNIWDVFVKIPDLIPNNATGDVTDHDYHHYKEDIDIMKEHNFDVYRFSISWSRIFLNGAGDINWEGNGDRVKNWFTFNEPRVVAALGFDTGSQAP